MITILVVILLILLVTGGGFYGRRAGWGGPAFAGGSGFGPRGVLGIVLLALIVILAIWVLNELLMPPLPMPRGVPSITR